MKACCSESCVYMLFQVRVVAELIPQVDYYFKLGAIGILKIRKKAYMYTKSILYLKAFADARRFHRILKSVLYG